MSSRSLSIALALACFGVTACRGAGGLAPADDAAIRKVVDEFTRTCAGEKADAAACARLYYTEDATLLLPGLPALRGREAIAGVWRTLGAKEMRVEINTLEGQGSVAYAQGTSTFTLARPGGKDVAERWRWLDVWKKQADGSWRLAYDAGNQETPSAILVPRAEPRPDASPELMKLASWVGRWKAEGRYEQTPVSPAGALTCDLECDWIAGGHQVACSMAGTGASTGYGEIYVMGYDPTAKAYTLFDADSNGFAGTLRGELRGQDWRFLLDTRIDGKPARLTFGATEESPDVKTQKAEMSLAGGPAMLVFEGRLTRAH